MDIFKSALMALLPISILTHFITYYAYKDGEITMEQEEALKEEKKEKKQAEKKRDKERDTKRDKKAKNEHEEQATNNFLHQKWVKFGGGFYGLMALLTFVHIEVFEVLGFLQAFEGWQTLRELLSIGTLIDFVVQSITNFIKAMVWFSYWPKHIDMLNGWVWLGMTYAGYHLGRELAILRLKSD